MGQSTRYGKKQAVGELLYGALHVAILYGGHMGVRAIEKTGIHFSPALKATLPFIANVLVHAVLSPCLPSRNCHLLANTMSLRPPLPPRDYGNSQNNNDHYYESTPPTFFQKKDSDHEIAESIPLQPREKRKIKIKIKKGKPSQQQEDVNQGNAPPAPPGSQEYAEIPDVLESGLAQPYDASSSDNNVDDDNTNGRQPLLAPGGK